MFHKVAAMSRAGFSFKEIFIHACVVWCGVVDTDISYRPLVECRFLWMRVFLSLGLLA